MVRRTDDGGLSCTTVVHHDVDVPGTGSVRTCIGCRRRAAKGELLRVVAGTDSTGRPAVVPDPRGVAPGRGAHLHPTTACYDAAVRRRAFTRALKSGTGLASDLVAEHLQDSPPARTDHPTDTTRKWSSDS